MSSLPVQPCKIWRTKSLVARRLRIIHISDTHLNHDRYFSENLIPDGDVLVHSGDFSNISISKTLGRDYCDEVKLLNDFFARLPHRYKIFVAGNHERSFYDELHSCRKRISELLTECIYLQDSSVIIEGVKFHGTPWNGIRQDSEALAFAVPYGPKLAEYWNDIPSDTDVLITHNPPYGILDVGLSGPSGVNNEVFCQECQETHKGCFHYGCPQLKRHVLERIRPMVHLFGHAHESSGTQVVDNVLFCNAAMTVAVIDLYVDTIIPSRL